MKFTFFPRNWTFWIYHWSGMLMVVVITQGSRLAHHDVPTPQELLREVAWFALFTGPTLFFRKLYKTTRIAHYSTSRILGLIFVYGHAAALLMTIVAIALVLPTVLDAVRDVVAKNPGKSIAGEFTSIIIGNTLQSALFVCLWLFIYHGVTNYRRKQEVELINLRLQNSLKEAQLNSLANQLNPHFLFNALNNIRFMMHENVVHADEMVVCLSDILRHSLGTSQRDKIPLAEELQIIARYIDLVKIQFDERLRFDVSIGAGLHDCLAPPMILQLLVENAVKHGVDRLRAGATISLSVSTLADQLNICLVNEIPEKHSLIPYAGTGTGLKNIEQRLHLLYGGEASLSRDVVDGRFVACIALPIERAL